MANPEKALELSERLTADMAIRTPYDVAIVKVFNRCDIACSYCYVYTGEDQSWRNSPPFMEDDVMKATAERIVEHGDANGLDRMLVVFHGGEPLLAEHTRPGYFGRAVGMFESAKAVRDSPLTINYGLQTNGQLLAANPRWMEMFARLNMQIGVSIDGGKEANDRDRLSYSGKSTHALAEAALRLVRQYPRLEATTLATINLRNNPKETYQYFKSLGVKSIGFNLPHATWDSPEFAEGYKGRLEPTGYGQWMCDTFDCWWSDSSRPAISLYQAIIRLLMGQPTKLEYFGPSIPNVAHIRTDGAIADIDTMTLSSPDALELNMNVFEHSLDDTLSHPKIQARQMGELGLAAACITCPVKDICGGGYFAHRHKEGSNPNVAFPELAPYLNPTVYCADLYQLINHVARRLAENRMTYSLMVRGGRGMSGIWRELVDEAIRNRDARIEKERLDFERVFAKK
ncbi:MAG TPA: radical SAM protein [Candidatus Saccharimonadales bacterium]|nr:radical SAM protein [Candidatus Saccharimonadales bacterium]